LAAQPAPPGPLKSPPAGGAIIDLYQEAETFRCSTRGFGVSIEISVCSS
jgi:hypothetical protein